MRDLAREEKKAVRQVTYIDYSTSQNIPLYSSAFTFPGTVSLSPAMPNDVSLITVTVRRPAR